MAERRKHAGKKPAHLAGPETAQQRIWRAIRLRALTDTFTSRTFTRADLEFDTKLPTGTVRGYVERLVAGGYLEGRDKLPKSKTCPHFTWQRYTLARDVGLQAPRLRRDGSPATQGEARERMWQTVRIQKGFSALDVQLAVNAANAIQVPFATAKAYLAQLARGGYLKVVQKARSGMGRSLARYALLPSMDTGPRSPVAQRSGAIYDINLDRVVWPT